MRTRDAIARAALALLLTAGAASAQIPTPKIPTPAAPKVPPLPTATPTPRPAIVGPADRPPQITMRGEPTVSNWSPKEYVVQGDKIVFTGDLVSSEFHARLGQVDLPIIAHGNCATASCDTFIHVRVPDTFSSPGAPLVVWYGVNGPKKTLTPSFKVLKKPRVASFKITDGPHINLSFTRGKDTKIEVELEDFDATAETFFRPSLWSPGCRAGGLAPKSEPGGSPYRLKYDFSFFADASGKNCPMEIQPYGSRGPALSLPNVLVPSLETYTVSDTWDLLEFTTPSGKKLSATASKGGLPCQLLSVGTAGTFSTGVVKEGGDLTFQLRNGALDEACRFETSPALLVRDDWAVKSVDWDFTEDSLCAAVNKFATQVSSGSTVTFFNDESAVFAVKFEALCKPNGNDLPKNSHVFKARLSSVKVIGPAGKSWRDAFK
ncbi:MAG TPA: hypothetical protein PLB01_10965 [Thermoanaerobaculia bacterium]|nr:hypothetical protein [Thermoanaerobaculia bacterium]